MNNPRVLAFAVTLAVLTPETLAFAQHSSPPSKAAQAEAGSRFKKGAELFEEGDYQAALIEFRRAYEIAPNFAVLYNIGQVYYLLQDYANALNTLERYLSEGDKSVSLARRRDVQKEIQKLQSRVAALEIAVNVPDAEISVDDVMVGKSPLAKSVVVNPGRHRIAISKAGFNSTSKSVEVASADAPKLAFELTEQAKPTASLPTAEPPLQGNGPGTNAGGEVKPPPSSPSGGAVVPPPPPPPVKRSVPWVGWAITGGLAVGAGVCGAVALLNSNDLKHRLVTPQTSREPIENAARGAKTFALVTDILTGAAVVAGGISLVFTLKGDAKPAAPAAAMNRAQGLPPELRVGVGPGGVSVIGAF